MKLTSTTGKTFRASQFTNLEPPAPRRLPLRRCINPQKFPDIPAGDGDADGAQDVDEVGVDDAVEDLVAVAAAAEDAGPEEDVEVARDVGLGEADLFDDVVDRAFVLAQGEQDAQARGVGEEAEIVRDVLE